MRRNPSTYQASGSGESNGTCERNPRRPVREGRSSSRRVQGIRDVCAEQPHDERPTHRPEPGNGACHGPDLGQEVVSRWVRAETGRAVVQVYFRVKGTQIAAGRSEDGPTPEVSTDATPFSH